MEEKKTGGMSIDINSPDFAETFKLEDAVVGVVGQGFVGGAVSGFFQDRCRVLVHDRAKPQLQTLDEVVKEATVVFVCVPTPMEPDGRCHTGIVEGVLGDLKSAAQRVQRNLDHFVVCIKSTVRPGFTEEMQERHFDMRLCFSPEFLTEANATKDFLHQTRVIVGGDAADALVVCKLFEGAQPKRVQDDQLLLLQCHPTVAEMTKLYANGMLATKVLFSNEVFLMCEKLGVEYEEVRALACIDPRIGSGHTRVPGPDGRLAVGGHCLPKDLNNLRQSAQELGVAERLFTAVLQRIDDLRTTPDDRDWEQMQGRAVIGKKQGD